MSGPGPDIAGYEIIRELGRGGFATVYEARQLSVDRLVALKVVTLTGIGADVERRFRAEIKTIGSLSWHPNVVALHDAGISETGLPFLAMELIDGGSWGARVEQGGACHPSSVLEVGIQVAEALAAAHAAGIIHRDVKPDNVLVGRLGQAMLADFGIATLTDGSASVSSSFVGTVAYSAPELLEGARADARADVYSTAATLYTLATGGAAYRTEGHESPAALIYRVASEPPPPLPQNLPRPLVEVIERGMARSPSDRPPTAKALAEALQDAQRTVAGSGTAPATSVDRRSTIAYREGGPTPGHPDAPRPPGSAGGAGAPAPSSPPGRGATSAPPAGGTPAPPSAPPAAPPLDLAAPRSTASATPPGNVADLGPVAAFPPRRPDTEVPTAGDLRSLPPPPDLHSLPPPPTPPPPPSSPYDPRRTSPYDPPRAPVPTPRPIAPTPGPVQHPVPQGPPPATPRGVWARTIWAVLASICCAPVGLLFAIGAHRRLLASGGRLRDKGAKGRWVVAFAYLWTGLALVGIVGVTVPSVLSTRSTTARYAGTWEGTAIGDPGTNVTLTLEREQLGLSLGGTLVTQGARGCLNRITDAAIDGGDATLTLEGRCEDGTVLRTVIAHRADGGGSMVLRGDLHAELQPRSP